MISVNFLHKGDEVLTLNDRILAIKRKDGTVDVFKVILGETEELSIYIEPNKIATIGYGNGTVEKELDDGTTVYSF